MNIKLIKSKEFILLIVVLLISLIISMKNIVFLRSDNIIDLLRNNAVLGIMAVGMLLAILTGGIDVSVASMIAAITVIIGHFLINISDNIILVFLIASISGLIMGFINGFLISKLKIAPIVVTLGTMSIISGMMFYITKGAWITGIPESFIEFGRKIVFKIPSQNGLYLGLPVPTLFFIICALLTWFILKYTVIGRGIYAMGGNPVSARRLGYNTDAITIFIYSYIGFLVGIAAVIHTSIMRQVDPNAFCGFELKVIAAVVLGGASILGGSGSVFGTMLGVVLFSILSNGLILMHIPVFWHSIVIGIILLVSVSIDVMQRKMAKKTQIRVDI